jgi:hypothetical protein
MADTQIGHPDVRLLNVLVEVSGCLSLVAEIVRNLEAKGIVEEAKATELFLHYTDLNLKIWEMMDLAKGGDVKADGNQ